MLINGKEISEWGENELLRLIKEKEIKESPYSFESAVNLTRKFSIRW